MTVEQIEEFDITQLRQTCLQQFSTINQQSATITALGEDNHKLQGQVAWLNRQQFGRKSERYEDPNQQTLTFATDGAEEASHDEPADSQTITYDRKKPASRGRGKRQPIPADLPRVERIFDLPEDQKTDSATGESLVKIGEKASEQLNFVPGRIEVIRNIRYVYARPGENLDGQNPEVLVAPRLAEGLPKCLAAPGLLAEIVVRKYADHLPLDRLEKIFKRSGFELNKASMCRWVQGVGELCEPLIDLMKQRMLEHSQVIQVDETPVRQQDPGKGKTKECRFWPYLGQPDTAGHYVVFDYTQDRKGENPRNWFRDAQGDPVFVGKHLQCDGYSGYQALFDPQGDWHMTHVGCWAHVRRKFFDAKQTNHTQAKHALSVIQKLYEIQRAIKDASDSERKEACVKQSLPLVNDFFAWCRQQQSRTLPKLKLGEALTYALNQEASLRAYLQHSHLSIDNNACERSLRGIAIGRKNWLFIGSPNGGKAAARLFSLIGSAKLHDVEPLSYLRDLITRLPAAKSDSDLEQFLPDVWEK